ncbi:hypothetical protein [Burkholderia cenocepacia]|uniref:hypothetical protein n=1 Tax=Burkholderia cenocepacia TaxID=95486 RepID=UPI002AB780E0|nr:hypothetical protein [Burkholderia cenocepacia]
MTFIVYQETVDAIRLGYMKESDVPEGKPYFVFDEAIDIERAASLDFSKPDGVGAEVDHASN